MFWDRINSALFTRLHGGSRSHYSPTRHVVQLIHLALFVALFAAFVPAQPAAAAPRNVERVIAFSERNSNATRSATVKCPSGKKVISTAANINGEVGVIALTGIAPNGTLTNVKVTAAEVGAGTRSTWSVTAIAICADPLPGLQRVSVTSISNSDSQKLVNAICPTGQKVLGVGASIKGLNGGQGALHTFHPISAERGVLVGGAETGAGTTQSWSMRADAICVDASAVPDLQRVEVGNLSGSDTLQSATAFCPSGKQVIGAGGSLHDAPSSRIALFGINPDPALTRVNTTGVEIAGGTTGNWTVHAYAMCASVERL
jgi:hypothetical protein